GPLPAAVRARPDGALVFEVLSREFPLKSHPIVVLEDLPSQKPEAFGELGRLWFGGAQGLKSYARSDLEGDVQAQVSKLLDALRRNAVATFNYRAASHAALTSREKFEQSVRLERSLKRATQGQRDLVQTAFELADRLGPHGAEVPVFLTDALAVPIANPAFPPAALMEAGAVRPAAEPVKISPPPGSAPSHPAADGDGS